MIKVANKTKKICLSTRKKLNKHRLGSLMFKPERILRSFKTQTMLIRQEKKIITSFLGTQLELITCKNISKTSNELA